MSALDDITASLAKFRTAKQVSGTSGSYKKANPTEYGKVIAYLDGAARPTGVTTDMGMALLLEEDARRKLIPVSPPPPPPPPASARWPANPFPLGSVYNPGQPISASAPLDPNSASIIAFWTSRTTGGYKFGTANYGVAIQEVTGGETFYPIEVIPDGHGVSTINRWGGVPIKAGTLPDPELDGHLTILDYRLGREYSFWQARYVAARDVWQTTCGQANTFAELNMGFQGTPYYCGANTAQMPGSAGLVAPEEIQAGVIKHPLVMFAGPIGTPSETVYRCPASGGYGFSTNANAPVAGMWFQMDPTLNVSALAIPAWQKTIVVALQQYGAFIRDQSVSDSGFYGETVLNRPTAPSWVSLGLDAGNQLLSTNIPWSRMRVLSPPC